jgi:hypothetical protein
MQNSFYAELPPEASNDDAFGQRAVCIRGINGYAGSSMTFVARLLESGLGRKLACQDTQCFPAIEH